MLCHSPAILERLALLLSACLAVVGVAAAAGDEAALPGSEGEAFFETSIRPLLVERCLKCHGPEKQSGELRLDTRDAMLAGGDSGPAIVPGRSDESLLIQAVRQGELKMPPDGRLAPHEVAALEQWVRGGAHWPARSAMLKPPAADVARTHWAFQPVREPPLPQAQPASWVRTPVDAFVLERLDAAGLSPSPPADRRTLIRRLSYSLTGLPPSPEEVEAFVQDPDPQAYEQLVERLLASEHYGEHWARHWLDVARYSDTKGYVYAREERFWIHAWTYRDWVVQALNRDVPYNRFLLLQIAADQVDDRDAGDLAAMGFLTLGRRFLGVERDIIDDRIDVVCRGTMGLTVGCARCHDHKYDPVPMADYYGLYGVFDSCREEQVRLASPTTATPEAEAELTQRQAKLRDDLQQVRRDWSERVRSRIGDYLTAQTELQKYPPKGFDQVFSTGDMLPEFVRRWENYLRDARRRGDPVFVPWHAYADLSAETFAAEAAGVAAAWRADSGRVNPLVAAEFESPPASFADVIQRYAALFNRIHSDWQTALAQAQEAGQPPPATLPDPAAEQLRRVLYGAESPCEVPDEPIVQIESYMETAACERLWKLQGEVDRWINQSLAKEPWAVALIDRPQPATPRIFRRGNPATPGVETPRQFLSLLAGPERKPFTNGSGRRELAEAIIDPANPLTPRVIVNRVWTQHFGAGLVDTPSDFGLRADPPSHPELLDWLAARFVAEGWSLKQLHRWIVLSSTYQQSSRGPSDANVLARAMRTDPGNRDLWRMNPHRLSFEEFRDSLLAASGALDLATGGRPSNLFQPPYPTRRTLYGLVDRQFFPNVLRVFDFANPDLHTPQRLETTVPQQALFVLNHPFVLERARQLAGRTSPDAPIADRITQMYRAAYQRPPTAVELAEATEFLSAAAAPPVPPPPPTAKDWQYAFGRYDETTQRVENVTPLPHFTGDAWQGGEAWPDAKLGWVQLTAAGGHPGNDRDHAAVRRWVAPRAMTVRISSRLTHEPAPGDGIRAFIVSSRAGLLASGKVHQHTQDFGLDAVTVEASETIDFVVDVGDVLNSDQYLWRATLTDVSSAEPATPWDSSDDFPANTESQLTAWEQFAQVLLGANEFLFVD